MVLAQFVKLTMEMIMKAIFLAAITSVTILGAGAATVQADTIPVHGYLGIAYGR